MDLKTVKLSEESMQAALKLRLKVELHLGKNIKKVQTVESMLTLLKYSGRSEEAEIKTAYNQLIASLTSDQLSFFKTLGLNNGAAAGTGKNSSADNKSSSSATYRGAHFLNKKAEEKAPGAADDSGAEVAADEKQRKKKMYRGREVL